MTLRPFFWGSVATQRACSRHPAPWWRAKTNFQPVWLALRSLVVVCCPPGHGTLSCWGSRVNASGLNHGVSIETPWFRPEAFTLDPQQDRVPCPGGQQTTTKERSANHTGWKFVFARHQGAGCLLQARCVATLPQKKGRSVIKNDYQAEYDAARARAT